MPHSDLGHGLLTGRIGSVDDFPDDDRRTSNPRFTGENFARNLLLVDVVRSIEAEIGATPAQTALAEVQLDRLNALEPAAGARHDDANTTSIDR